MDDAIGIDWGTSSLRATLFNADGTIRDERSRPWGIRQLPDGGFERAFADICDGWPTCPAVASGMVGSRQGWREAAYVDVPADAKALADNTATFATAGGRILSIVPGVRDRTRPDVMRGEETEIVGALALYPDLASTPQIVLPGTHSKWVDIQGTKIVGFRTVMTGELYALLTRHSILGAMIPPDVSTETDWRAFDEGVSAARASGNGGALTTVFSARTLVLEARLETHAVPSYLSGLLIGDEWRAMLASGWLQPGRPPLLVGDTRHCALYRRAATAFALSSVQMLNGAAARGLWQIHMALSGHAGAASISTEGHA